MGMWDFPEQDVDISSGTSVWLVHKLAEASANSRSRVEPPTLQRQLAEFTVWINALLMQRCGNK